MITVQLIGGASLRSGNTSINGPPAQCHRIARLTLIVAAWPQPLSRDRAMALLWPERDTAGGRRLLNLAMHVLRGALGQDAITSTGDALLLNPSLLTRKILHSLEALARSAYVSPYYFAYAYVGLGDADRAMDWLERAVAERAGPSYSIKGSLLLAPLRTHPRFRALLRQMKLEPDA